LNAEMIVATAMVRANWRKNCPEMPPRKTVGMNTADSSIASSTPCAIASAFEPGRWKTAMATAGLPSR
jgi:hypothetical protein